MQWSFFLLKKMFLCIRPWTTACGPWLGIWAYLTFDKLLIKDSKPDNFVFHLIQIASFDRWITQFVFVLLLYVLFLGHYIRNYVYVIDAIPFSNLVCSIFYSDKQFYRLSNSRL